MVGNGLRPDVWDSLSPHVGGIILFERNFKSRQQLESLCSSIRSVKQNILIAVDHEGGRVQRFKKEFTQIGVPR